MTSASASRWLRRSVAISLRFSLASLRCACASFSASKETPRVCLLRALLLPLLLLVSPHPALAPSRTGRRRAAGSGCPTAKRRSRKRDRRRRSERERAAQQRQQQEYGGSVLAAGLVFARAEGVSTAVAWREVVGQQQADGLRLSAISAVSKAPAWHDRAPAWRGRQPRSEPTGRARPPFSAPFAPRPRDWCRRAHEQLAGAVTGFLARHLQR